MIVFSKRDETALRLWSRIPGERPAPLQESLVAIVFKGAGAQVVAGSESQQVYCFSAQDPEQMVDAKDADALLRTGLFSLKR